jgi:Flp pilus assembly protein TadG
MGINSLVNCWKNDRRGNIAILFGLSLTPTMLMIGLAVDYGRLVSAGVGVQAALDSAALAASRAQWQPGMNDARLGEVASQFFFANLPGSDMICETPHLSRVEEMGTISLAASCTQERQLGAMAIEGAQYRSVASEAIYRPMDIDLAMMLDVSGSMNGSKLTALKKAASSLVDHLETSKRENMGTVRFALAPYSSSVNVGNYFQAYTDIEPADAATTCVSERTNGHALTDTPPTDTDSYFPVIANAGSCPNAKISALTEEESAVKSRLHALQAGGMTAGHQGIAHAWYLVSHRWAGLWPEASRPLAKDAPHSMKAVILMTDGMFNIAWGGPGSSSSQARKLCDAMKDDGIIIYSVAFQAPGSAENLLKYCATSPAYFFKAKTGEELNDAYQRIAESLSQMRISK